jgi:hypothetical protein
LERLFEKIRRCMCPFERELFSHFGILTDGSNEGDLRAGPPGGVDNEMRNPQSGELAGIEYVGLPGISEECQNAVLRLLQFGDKITHARILSSSGDHCLLLTVHVGDIVAVKSGFASGYLGEGPRTFSYVLEVLEAHWCGHRRIRSASGNDRAS